HARVLVGITTGRIFTVAGNDACHVGPMSIEIGSARIARNKAFAIHDARSGAGIFLQVVVVVNAAVNHGNSDAAAIQCEMQLGDVGCYCRRSHRIECRRIGTVRGYISDVRMVFQKLEHYDRNPESTTVNLFQTGCQLAALATHHGQMLCLELLVELDDDIYGAIRIDWEISNIRGNIVSLKLPYNFTDLAGFS